MKGSPVFRDEIPLPRRKRLRFERRCETCHNVFRVAKKRRDSARFCSWTCRVQFSRGQDWIACEQCGISFNRRARKSAGRFCSDPCRALMTQRLKARPRCHRCGKAFWTQPSPHTNKYCGLKCFIADKKRRASRKCPTCSQRFWFQKSDEGRKRFCSKSCFTLFDASETPRKIKPLVAAWMAGFMDGEGTFTVSKVRQQRTVGGRGTKKMPYWYLFPLVVVNGTDRETIFRFKKLTGIGCFYKGGKPPKPNWNQIWCWRVTHKGAQKFIKLILPHLSLKKRIARLVLKFPQCSPALPDFNKTRRRQLTLYSKIRAMNRRGVKDETAISRPKPAVLPPV